MATFYRDGEAPTAYNDHQRQTCTERPGAHGRPRRCARAPMGRRRLPTRARTPMPSTTRSTFFTYPTKFGPVTIAADGTAVTAVSFGEQNLPGDRQPTALTTEAANQIMAYLAGQRSAFTVPMRPEGAPSSRRYGRPRRTSPTGTRPRPAPSPKRWGTRLLPLRRRRPARLPHSPARTNAPHRHRHRQAHRRHQRRPPETRAAASHQVALPGTGATETLQHPRAPGASPKLSEHQFEKAPPKGRP